MRKELKTLEDKINEFDKYCREQLDLKDPGKIIGPDPNSPQRKEFDKWAKELLDLANGANPFDKSKPDELNVMNRALVSLQFAKLGQDASNAYINPDNASKPEYATQAKKAGEAMMKFNMSLNGITQDAKYLSSAIDLDYITWLAATPAKEVKDTLEIQGAKQFAKSNTTFDVKKNVCVNFSTYAPLMPTKDGKGYKIDHAKMVEKNVAELAKDPRIKEMIKNYNKAEAKWVTSSIPDSTEIQYRIGFMNTYKEELRAINAAIGMVDLNNSEISNAINNEFEKLGIMELMKNYRYTMEPKTLDENFLVGGVNSFEYEFGKAMQEEAQNNPVNATKSKEVIEFRKMLYNSCKDENRHVVDEFNSLPETEQLKVMMIIQFKEQADLTNFTDESVKNYKPDMNKIKANICAPKWQFWKRIGSDGVNFNSLKKYTDKVLKGKEINDPANKLNMKTGKVAMIKGKLEPAVKDLGILNIGMNSNLYDKEQKAERSEVQHMEDVSKELGYGKKLAKEVKLAATAISKVPGMKVVGKCTGYLNVATTALETAENAQKLKIAKYRENQGKQLAEDVKGVDKAKLNEKERNIFKRIARSAKIQNVINKFRTKQAKLDVAKSATSVASKTAMIAGANAVGVVISGVSAGVTKGIQNNIDKESRKEIVDASIYEDQNDELKQISDTKKNLDRKYMRMSPKMQAKYKKYFDKQAMQKTTLKDVNRQEHLRKSGENTMDDLKKTVISDVKKETTSLMKEVRAVKQISGPLNEFQQKQIALTEKLATAVGVDYDVTTIKYDNILEKQQAAPQKDKQMDNKAKDQMVMA